jgi:iron complex outermembrane receptor protein
MGSKSSWAILMALLFAPGVLGAHGQQDAPQNGSVAAAAAAPSVGRVTQTVTVTASGETRAVQTVNNTSMLQAAPGTSPIAVVAQLPSVDFTTSDPYGAYEWATRISIRGFNQNQLGFTLDGVPLGDMSYGNWNGLHISRAVIDENVGRIVLSQGTGSVAMASTSNLGGGLQFYSLDPADKRSFTIDQSFGSFDAVRTYGRFESGLLPHEVKFYLAGVYQGSNKWKGHGQIGQWYAQFNAKVVKYFGSKAVWTTYADYSNRHEVDYQDLNKIWEQKLGYHWDNYGNWQEAIQAAYACDGEGSYPAPVNTLAANEDPCDAAYYGGSGLRRDFLGYSALKVALMPKLLWRVTGYGHRDDGRGLWFTPYTPSPDGSPISLRTSEYGISRGGFLTSLEYDGTRNRVKGGVWFEGETWDLARRFYATSVASPMHSLYHFPKNPFATQWAYSFPTTVYQFYLQEEYHVTPSLTLAAGFKTVETNTDGKLAPEVLTSSSYTPGQYAQGSLESGKPFLPQFGVDWKVDQHNELFADGSYNVRAYQPGGYGYGNTPWGTTQAGFDQLKKTLKPETAWSEEVGYRRNTKRTAIEVSYFHVNFNDRLLAIAQGVGIQGFASILSNVGGVTTNGVDAAATVQLGHGFSLYNGATWSRSVYDNNIFPAGQAEMYTKGKVAVDAPEGLWKSELSWKDRHFFANLSSDYMSERYFTYSNDGHVAGRFLTNVGMGYHRSMLGELDALNLQLNVDNLTNAQYYSTIGTNGFIYSDPLSLSDNTLQVGAPVTTIGEVSFRF